MRFVLNGQPQEVAAPLSVFDLLRQHDLHRKRVAVAINTEVVPKSRFDAVRIAEGDAVEVIQAVGGG